MDAINIPTSRPKSLAARTLTVGPGSTLPMTWAALSVVRWQFWTTANLLST